MELATTTTRRRRTPDTAVNGVILSPKRAELLTHAIRARLVTSEDGLRAFLAGLEREQRAEDKKDPEVAALVKQVWQKTAPKARGVAPPTPQQRKTNGELMQKIHKAEQEQSELEASMWKPAGAGMSRTRRLNLDPAQAEALMRAVADTAKLRELLSAS